MFRDEYKACFDDIKGEKAVLEKILKNNGTTKRKTNVIKMHRNVISATAAVFVLAMAGFMYNMGMFDGFLPSENNDVVITEKTENAKSVETKEKAIEEKIQKDNIIKEEKEEKVFTADVDKNVEENQKQTESVNEGISVASTEEGTAVNMSARMLVEEPTEYKGLSVFKEGIEEITEKYDETEKKFSYTDFEETKKIEITYYNEMPAFDDENAGGDVLEYIGETPDGFVKITAFGITEEYMSEIIESF